MNAQLKGYQINHPTKGELKIRELEEEGLWVATDAQERAYMFTNEQVESCLASMRNEGAMVWGLD